MTKRAAIKRQTRETSREHGVLDTRQFMEDSKVRRLPTHAGWSPYPSNDDRDQAYLKTLKPKSEGQAEMMAAIDHHNLVLALGPAGTGKTYLAVAKAVEALEAGKIGRIVLSRPAVEAGESIGFLPGDMEDKLAPYLRPLYDALSDRLGMKRVKALMAEGLIETLSCNVSPRELLDVNFADNLIARAMAAIDRDEVLEARMASLATTSSNALNRACLGSSCSTMASITTSAVAKAFKSLAKTRFAAA